MKKAFDCYWLPTKTVMSYFQSLRKSYIFFLTVPPAFWERVSFFLLCGHRWKCQIGSEQQLIPTVEGSKLHGLFLGKLNLGIALF